MTRRRAAAPGGHRQSSPGSPAAAGACARRLAGGAAARPRRRGGSGDAGAVACPAPGTRTARADPRPRGSSGACDFAVSPATLIPRPESETLMEAAIAAFALAPPRRILDLGHRHRLPAAGRTVGVPRRVRRRRGPFAGRRRAGGAQCRDAAAWRTCGLRVRPTGPTRSMARFDLVLCNPPYIPTSELNGLMPEVARYEPRSRLDGGPDGLSAYRRLLPDLPRLLTRDRFGRAGTGAWAGRNGGRAGAGEAGLAGTRNGFVRNHTRIGASRGRAMKKPFGRAGRQV